MLNALTPLTVASPAPRIAGPVRIRCHHRRVFALSLRPADVAEPPRRYDPPHILWYFGAITASLAASATALAVEPRQRGIWQLLVALLFLALFAAAAVVLLQAGWRVPGGAVLTAAVTLVPAVGQGFERLIGVWPDANDISPSLLDEFQGAPFALAVATILVGLVAFAGTRFPFVLAPVTVATLFAGELLVPLLYDGPGPDDFAKTTLVTGAVLVLVGLVLDSRVRHGEAFWWHVVGLYGVAAALAWYTLVRDAGWAWIAVLVVGAILVAASAPLERATWASYGVVGVYVAALHYAAAWLDSWREPLLMVIASLGLIAIGIVLRFYAHLWARLQPPAAAPPPPPPADEVSPPPDTT
jgi:hypothetical protein